jgi:predicted Zn finger-like uncharacterized protein
MPVEFTCPECHRGYRVKDELAGKTAKCGKCGHRMRIPALEGAVAAAPVKASPTSAAPPRPVAKSPAAAPKAKTPAASWLDEELEGFQPKAPSAPRTASKSCPACSASLAPNAVLCVSCGYDTRTHAKHETKHVDLGAETTSGGKKRGKLAGAASLLRGTLFSFIAAIIGAAIWTAIAAATGKEFSLVAWGLGGLVGLGMALGHDDEDGTFAGIIAAFMSLLGIVAAKVFIIIFVIAPALAAMFDEIEGGAIGDPAQAQAAAADAGEELEQQADDAPALAAQENADVDDAADPDGEAEGLIGLFFASMFSPVDGIFILLAFFTAYGVGSGQMTD